VLCRFNKTRHNFATDEDWFDYQELTEDHSKPITGSTRQQFLLVPSSATHNMFFAVFKLVEGQDVQQTEAAIEEYKKANFGNIVANEAKKVLLYSMSCKKWEIMHELHGCACQIIASRCMTESDGNCTSMHATMMTFLLSGVAEGPCATQDHRVCCCEHHRPSSNTITAKHWHLCC